MKLSEHEIAVKADRAQKLWLSPPHMGDTEMLYVQEAFSTNWLAPVGPHLNKFEERIAAVLGVRHAIAVSSGTAAIHLALQAVGVKSGDLVICQSFTFAATAFPILYLGAEPIFIDSERDTWNMDPDLLEETLLDLAKAGKRPAAIVMVHLYGMPAQMDRIRALADAYRVPVIEDAAEALGSTYQNRACGSLGDVSVLSFNGNKIITTTSGGAVCCNDNEWAAQMRLVANQAKEEAPYYLHEQVGYNYRMSNVLAAIGCGQLEVLTERVNKRRKVYETYAKAFEGIAGIRFQPELAFSFSNRWLTVCLFHEDVFPENFAANLVEALNKVQIEARRLWKPLHQQPVFKSVPFMSNGVSDQLFASGICLPSGSAMTEDDIQRVIETTLNFVHQAN